MDLTHEQKKTLYEEGAVHLPGVVPTEVVERALRAINASLGGEGIDPARLTTFRSQSYCPEITKSPAIAGLLHDSPLWSLAESAIGPGAIKPVNAGQIALRFPTNEAPHDPRPHIDGMYTPTNGVPKGTIGNFTSLIGVFLSDIPHDYMGNFTIWPGTHRLYEDYFRAHGPQALLEGMPQVDLPQPRQVTGRAGDAMLCHYQLGHGIAGNGSPYIRYAVYFRLSHVDHDSLHWECMTDIWREWGGMQEIAGREREPAHS